MKYQPSQEPFEERPENSSSSLGSKYRLFIVLFVLVVAFVYFGFTALNEATAYYLTVDEANEKGELASEERFQIKGSLVSESFERLPDNSGNPTTLSIFTLSGECSQLIASYDGALPELFFNPHSEIVLGGYFGTQGIFVADRVLVKCPSKYQSIDYELPADYAETVNEG